MLASAVDTARGAGACAEVSSIRRTPLHAHPGVLEIVYVLRGALHARVSFERFDLVAGDFIVVNAGDPHQLLGVDDNLTAVLHADLSAFADIDPFPGDIIFACESFDLVRYRGHESELRAQILDVVASLVGGGDLVSSSPPSPCRELVRVLASSYSLESYYHRDREPNSAQRNMFHTVVRYLGEHADQRDVLGQLAERLHYSKSRVSHLVKDVSGISFSDLLTFVRVNRGERLLLDGDDTIVDVSAACGFSDVKYFTRAFNDWFHQQPSEYRRTLRPEMLGAGDIRAVAPDAALAALDLHRGELARTSGAPRLSITPLLLKNVGSRLDLYETIRTADVSTTECEDAPENIGGIRHLVPIEIDLADLDSRSLLYSLTSFDQIDATPCLVLRFTTRTAVCADLEALRERLGDGRDVAIWLVYAAMSDRRAVDAVVAFADAELGLSVQPILRPS